MDRVGRRWIGGLLGLMMILVVGGIGQAAEKEEDSLKGTAAQLAKLDGELAGALDAINPETAVAYRAAREAWEKYRSAQAKFEATSFGSTSESFDKAYRLAYERITKERIAYLETMLEKTTYAKAKKHG